MAYVSKETKKELAPEIKKVLAEFGVKGTIKVDHGSTLCVTLRKVPAGLFGRDALALSEINVYHIDTFYDGTARKFLNKLLAAMKGDKWYDNTNSMIYYFDTAWYNSIKIGEWDKPVEII